MKILQYCSVCKAEYEMVVVPTSDGDDDGVVWLQCPSCKGFLPKVSSSADLKPVVDEDVPAEAGEDASAPAEHVAEPPADGKEEAVDVESDDEPVEQEIPADDPLADMDVSTAVPYRPWETYAEGDVIHHLAWDDYGVVVAKEVLPGNRRVVRVHFSAAGVVRLIEQEGEGP